MTNVRKGQYPGKLSREAFRAHFSKSFADPLFVPEHEAIGRLEAIAWNAYCQSRKAPITRKAGPGFADPDYELSLDWIAAHDALIEAEKRQKKPASPSRVLVICAAARNDGTCPGEMSKSYRLAKHATAIFEGASVVVDFLDLSNLVSEYGQKIHPCKACVSTAMPLCHWPCSCYPNHSLGQADDWMNEIYPKWVAAHGVLIVTPVYWYQAPSTLKLMIDRLVCADGGNPDPTSTAGKDVAKAKEIELAGWSYPKHLAGRTYGLVVHGDVAATESVRRSLADWLEWMGLIPAGNKALVDRYIGYYEPYASSHEALDRDTALFEEVANAARALTQAVGELRRGRLSQPGATLATPRPK
ncbi:MAG TPA: flavodoxin family protein [Stellaceae bacterium]|jgi:multimeric flavodoxin WrbA